jgi:protein-S-isoprenylcysteine O-methyltransferase
MPNPMFYFVSSAAKDTFVALFCIYWISEILIGRRMRAGRQDRTDDRGSLRLLAIVFPLAWWAAVAIIWAVPQASIRSTAVFGAGLIIMVAGQLLRWWSIATLGRLFTINVAIRSGHQLVDTGPYRYIRHPSYTAILLFCLGAGLCFSNVLSLGVLVIPTTAALFNRIRVEEDVLQSGLGDAYRNYMTRTWRLLPGLY